MMIRDEEIDLIRVNKVVGRLRFGTPKPTECADNVKHTEPIDDWLQKLAKSSECWEC